ncbi:hypothetical protein SSS_03979 [Sarcoptes scabiei]|nr:hypothetical protein SSS_03979 [Sarcoptes scabiei]
MGRKFGDSRIKALILQGCVTYASDTSTKRILWSRDLQNWDQEMLKRYISAYDDDFDRVEDLWQRHIDFAIEKYGEFYPKGLLGPVEDGLKSIKCSTMILHGDRDFFVELQQAEHIVRNVPKSRLIRFNNCGHNLHQVEPIKFKQTLEKFLSENI